MNDHKHEPAIVHDFSLSFEQMCSVIAIGQVRSPDETLQQLLLHCLVFLPDDKFYNENDFKRAFENLFGLQIPEHEISFALGKLISANSIRRASDEHYVIVRKLREKIEISIEEAKDLEITVRENWCNELKITYPDIPFDVAWKALTIYLAKAFQRHGMQTISILDTSIEIPHGYSSSLTDLLNITIRDYPIALHINLRKVISGFLATTGDFPERATYISQLADGAFDYFSLTVEANLADQFRNNMSSLTIFLDTNFLFGILDLTVNPLVAVSNELIFAIQKHSFPIKLVTHQKTQQELISSIGYYDQRLRSRKWSRAISKAASTSPYLSGVELRYHQQFATKGLDVETYFKPYQHADVILREKKIDLFVPKHERLEERAELINEYQTYLTRKNKDKSYRLIDHDMTVLDVVRNLRSDSKSSLDAGALLLTCDYHLYRFDWETSRKAGVLPCTVLPNLLWQILRPYVPSDVDFDHSFAETFAIPEFRSIGSGASDACSKMLNILASYKDFPEETAARMLASDLLIDKLRTAESDEAFLELIEEAIVTDNAELAEELTILVEQLEQERTEKAKLEEQKLLRDQALIDARKVINQYQEINLRNEERISTISVTAESEKRAREIAENHASNLERELAKKEKYYSSLKIALCILLCGISIAILELAVYRIPWSWLVSHPNSYGLQLSADFFIIVFICGGFYPKWRRWLWGAAGLSIFAVILQLVGGPES